MPRYEKDPDWARWRREKLEPLGLGPVAPPNRHAWREMRPAGQPQPRDLRIAEFKALREMIFGPVMPPSERPYLGPPPSDPKYRLYEHKRKGLLGGLRGPNPQDIGDNHEEPKKGDNL